MRRMYTYAAIMPGLNGKETSGMPEPGEYHEM